MTLNKTNKAGLPYTASEFRQKVYWLVQKVVDHTEKLFRCKATEVGKAEGTRMRAVHRWERSMLCQAKEELYGRTPHVFNKRFEALRKRIDKFPLMKHSSLVSRFLSEVQRLGQEAQTSLILASLLRVLSACQRHFSG